MTETRTLTVAPHREREILIRRSFAAPRRLVFDAWTRPELLRRWFGPRNRTLVVCEIDLRAGGAWHYVLGGPEGEEMVMRGVYREVVAPARLVTSETHDGSCSCGEMVKTTVFDEQDGVTTLTTTVRYASAEARDGALASGMERGTAEGYDQLDEVLAEGLAA